MSSAAVLVQKYKTYGIYQPTSGGRAGRGYEKTSTIQVRGNDQFKQFRYKVGVVGSQKEAIKKAKKWIDNQLSPQ